MWESIYIPKILTRDVVEQFDYKNYQNTKVTNTRKLKPCIKNQTTSNTKKQKQVFLCSCGKERLRNAKGCMECHHKKKKELSKKPSAEVLQTLVLTIPMTSIGKMFGVSDNAVRKWLKSYDITLPNMLGFWSKNRNN
jgi:hypothetical protein